MKNGFSRPLGRICTLLLIVMLGLSVARLAYSTPIEEDISGSDSLSAPQPSSTAARSTRFEVTGDNPAAQDSDEAGTSDQSAQISDSTAPRAPRATFPYIVRSGDTPAAIAELFGVQ